MQRLAVVIPIFNERDTLPELQRRLCAAFAAMPDVAASVVYVNDGSRDDSLAAMLRQQQDDPRFGAIDLSRNFGHQAALTAGLAAVGADADAVGVAVSPAAISRGTVMAARTARPREIRCAMRPANVRKPARRMTRSGGSPGRYRTAVARTFSGRSSSWGRPWHDHAVPW